MKKTKSFSYAKYGYIFSIPFVVAYLIFSLYPTINTVMLGFTDAKGMAGLTNWHFLPAEDLFKNFIAILNAPTFRKSLVNTMILWILNFIPQISLALLLTAWFTSKRNELRGQGFFKVVFYMPNIIPAASIAILFKALFAYPVGPVNSLLVKLGLADEAINFTTMVWPTRGIIAFIQFWMWYGNTMIVMIAGIMGINPALFEAGLVDGCSSRQIFWKITLPLIKPILLYNLVTSLVGGLTMFDIPHLMTQGDPNNTTNTVARFIYQQGFTGSYNFNYASAASVILFGIIVICSLILSALLKDRDVPAKRKGASR